MEVQAEAEGSGSKASTVKQKLHGVRLSLKVPYMALKMPRSEPLEVQKPKINVFCFSGAVKAKV